MSARRLLGLIALLLVLAALALWASSQGRWVTGAEPILLPWAVLALAAVGGLVATGVWGRRLIGVLVAVAGGWAVLRAAVALIASAAAVPWPLVAMVGGLLMLAAGALAARYAVELPRLGARYDAPGAGPREPRPVDPDRALWDAQDEGADPTVDGPGRA